MATITINEGCFWVLVNGSHRGSFGAMVDANWYAMALLKEGLVDSVVLVSGLEIR
jgi:hypothetical protein